MEVVEPIKGVKKGDVVWTAMLSAHRNINQLSIGMANQPGMVDPDKGRIYLLFLLPTTQTNLYASFTAPYDDDQAIFRLDKIDRLYQFPPPPTYSENHPFYERTMLFKTLVNDTGQISAEGVAQMRDKYWRRIKMSPSRKKIPLQWVKATNPAGWSTDVPKGASLDANLYDQPPK